MYDGSIRIDTRISTAGLNQGTKTITTKLGAVLESVKRFAQSMQTRVKGALTAIKNIAQITGVVLTRVFSVAALGVWFAAFQGIIKSLRENLVGLLEKAGLGPQVEQLKGAFEELKLAVANAFLPLVIAALPYVQQFTDWLITALNKIAQITAALLGQKNVLQVIAGSLKKAGKEIEKSARGALAAFDQLNVLDKNEENNSNPLAAIATELVPVDSEVSAQIEKIKRKFEEIKKWFSWDYIKQKTIEAWEEIKIKISDAWEELKRIFINTWDNFLIRPLA